MNINEIESFYKQQAEFAKQIEKAKTQYANFLEGATKKYFYPKPEDFKSSYEEEIEEIRSDCEYTYAVPEPWEILEYMFFPKIREQLYYLESSQSLTRVDRLKIEFPDIEEDNISRLINEVEYYSLKINIKC